MLFRADLRLFVSGFKVNAGAYEGAGACALFRDSAPDMFALMILFFCGKRRNSRIAWFGAVGRSTSLTTPFSSCSAKLDALIKALLGKSLEQCIGLLIWATSTQVLASTAVRGPQQPTRLDALDTASNVVSL